MSKKRWSLPASRKPIMRCMPSAQKLRVSRPIAGRSTPVGIGLVQLVIEIGNRWDDARHVPVRHDEACIGEHSIERLDEQAV